MNHILDFKSALLINNMNNCFSSSLLHCFCCPKVEINKSLPRVPINKFILGILQIICINRQMNKTLIFPVYVISKKQ